jgi:benzoylformate decarboxylase
VPPPSGEVITAAHVLATLNALLPDNAVVVEEIPSHRPDLHQHLPITAPHAGFLTTGGGVLGHAIPAAVGAALAAPLRRVVAVVGDGSAMYRPQGLWTAARQHIPLTIIVLDNRGYSALRSMADNAGVHGVPGLDLGGIDFVGLARSMGCNARSVSSISELHDVLSGALDAAEPTVVHVVVR